MREPAPGRHPNDHGEALKMTYARKRARRRCFVCARAAFNAKVIRFALVIHPDRFTSKSAGGINLCSDCWDESQRRDSERRRPRRRAA